MAQSQGAIYDPQKIHLAPLRPDLDEAGLRTALEAVLGADHGIHAVSIPPGRDFGFVEFSDEAKASAAKAALDGVSVAAISGGDNDAAAPPLRASHARDREAERRAERERRETEERERQQREAAEAEARRAAAELELPPLPPEEEPELDIRPWRVRHPKATKALWALGALLAAGIILGVLVGLVAAYWPDGNGANATAEFTPPRPADAGEAPPTEAPVPAPVVSPTPEPSPPPPAPASQPPAPTAPPPEQQPVVLPPLPAADGQGRARVNVVVETTGTPPPAIGVAVWTGEPTPPAGNVSVAGWRPVDVH